MRDSATEVIRLGVNLLRSKISHNTPRLGILAEFGGIGPHGGLDREHVLAQRGRLRVLVHEGKGFGLCSLDLHTPPFTPQREHELRPQPPRVIPATGPVLRQERRVEQAVSQGASPVFSQRATGTTGRVSGD